MYTHYANFQFNCTLDFFFAIIFLPQKILRNPTQIHRVSFPPTQFVLLFRMNPALYLVPILLLQGGRTFPQILMSLFRNFFKFILVSYPQTLKYEIKVKTGIHSLNEVEDSFIEDILSTTYLKIHSLNTNPLLHRKVTVFLGTLWTVHFWEEFEMTEL